MVEPIRTSPAERAKAAIKPSLLFGLPWGLFPLLSLSETPAEERWIIVFAMPLSVLLMAGLAFVVYMFGPPPADPNNYVNSNVVNTRRVIVGGIVGIVVLFGLLLLLDYYGVI